MATGLLVHENGNVESVQYADYKDIQKLVDGFFEVVTTSKFAAYVDEEGKLKDKEINFPATKIWQEELRKDGFKTNDFLVGKVLFTGTFDKEGNDRDLNSKVRENIIQRVSTLMNE